jgi:hypothetical protein
MYSIILNTALIFSGFCAADQLLARFTPLDGLYYLLHSIHNGAIVYLTGSEVYNTITRFDLINTMPKNLLALECVYALHFYHIAIYWRKFRFDDWLHHILMIGVALPIGTFFDSKSLVGYSLFFTTGLPGGVDYFLLFLVRNGWLNRQTEKAVNTYLNVWCRSPGCVSHAVLTVAFACIYGVQYSLDWWAAITAATLTFWNGQYFMRQVVENYAVQNHNEQYHIKV